MDDDNGEIPILKCTFGWWGINRSLVWQRIYRVVYLNGVLRRGGWIDDEEKVGLGSDERLVDT